jgi:hypothetical protein
MRCARMASTSLLTFGCILLTLFLHAPPSKSGSNLIRIWIVGSPHTGALPSAIVPPDLRRRAESLGYTITVQSFQANGFTARFHEALPPNGWIEGVDSDRRLASSLALVHETLTSLQPRGWVMLVRSAANYEAARALSMRPAECDALPSRS